MLELSNTSNTVVVASDTTDANGFQSICHDAWDIEDASDGSPVSERSAVLSGENFSVS